MALDMIGSIMIRLPLTLNANFYAFEYLSPTFYSGRLKRNLCAPLGALAFNIFHPGDDVDVALLTQLSAKDFWELVAEELELKTMPDVVTEALYTGIMEVSGDMVVSRGMNTLNPRGKVPVTKLNDRGWKEMCHAGSHLRIRYVHVSESYDVQASFGRGPINCTQLSEYVPSHQTPTTTATQEHAALLHDTVYLASMSRSQARGAGVAWLNMHTHIRETYDEIRQYADACGVFSPRQQMGVLNSELLVWLIVRCVRKIDLHLHGDEGNGKQQASVRLGVVLNRLCTLRLGYNTRQDQEKNSGEEAGKSEGVVFMSHAGRNVAAHVSVDGAHAISTWLCSLRYTSVDTIQAYNRSEGLEVFMVGQTTFLEIGVSCWIDDPSRRLAFNDHALDIISTLPAFVRSLMPDQAAGLVRLWPHVLMDTQLSYDVSANARIFLIGLGADRANVGRESAERKRTMQTQLDKWLAETEYDRAWGHIQVNLHERETVGRLWNAP